MINDFLCRLVNDAGVSFGAIAKPANWHPSPYTGAKLAAQQAVLRGLSRRDMFRYACAVVLTLRGSAIRSVETERDERVSYSNDDLAAELAGSSDVVTAPAGVKLSYSITPSTPSEQLWSLRRVGVSSVSVFADGKEQTVSDVNFSATSQVSVTLKSIVFHITGVPALGSTMTVFRSAPLSISIADISAALARIPERDLLSVVRPRHHGLIRNAFAFNKVSALCAVADGIANG